MLASAAALLTTSPTYAQLSAAEERQIADNIKFIEGYEAVLSDLRAAQQSGQCDRFAAIKANYVDRVRILTPDGGVLDLWKQGYVPRFKEVYESRCIPASAESAGEHYPPTITNMSSPSALKDQSADAEIQMTGGQFTDTTAEVEPVVFPPSESPPPPAPSTISPVQKDEAAAEAGLGWLLGVWRIPQGGAVGFRREADGTASGYIAETTSALAEAGYSTGMVFLRGCQESGATAWRHSASCAEGFRGSWQSAGIVKIDTGETGLELPTYIGSPIAGYAKLERMTPAPVATDARPAALPTDFNAAQPSGEQDKVLLDWSDMASGLSQVQFFSVFTCGPAPAGVRPRPQQFDRLGNPIVRSWGVYGSYRYASSSPICVAAVHAGVISFEGGSFRLRRLADSSRENPLVGSERNEVTSGNWDYASSTFGFESSL